MQVARKMHVKTISEFAAILLAAFALVLMRFMFQPMHSCFVCNLIIPVYLAQYTQSMTQWYVVCFLKGAGSVGSQQTLQRWMITVGGVEQARVGAGQSVEIGRKPIRPLREDGFMRVDVVDNKRSMSKRHALLIVDTSGVATIRDLHSTNGTYLVNESGDLLRLDPGVDFHMPDSIVRMQFGDVPIDFVRIEEPAPQGSEDGQPVRDLFSYAPDNEIKEPDAADLSVDDILDIRAGEPTGVFHAQSVSRPDLVWNSQKRLNAAAAADDLGSVSAADAGADSNDNSTSAAPSSVEDVASVIDAASVAESVAEQIKPVIAGQVVLPVVRDEFESPVEPRNLFDDAAKTDAVNNDAINNDAINNDVASNDVASDLSNSNSEIDSQNVELQSESQSALQSESQESVQPNMQVVDQNVDQNDAQDAAQYDVDVAADSVNSVNPVNNVSDVSATIASGSAQFTPAFEPGSVFEKVSNGEFNARKEVVSAGGFTSEEAQKTDDFSEQFEMAKYQELLPFLAMNTNLYDDLYAWLSAQGNADVDQALAQNSGYNAYRNAIGL